jgi:transposase
MYLKCSGNRPDDDSIGYYKVVESYRNKENKVRQRILINLGAIPHEKADKLKALLDAYRKPDLVCTPLEDILVTEHKDYLDISVLYHLWQKWKLDELFAGFKYVVPMVINRCIDPKSKIGVTKWVGRTILPEILGIDYDNLNPFSIYDELEQLNQLDEQIQKHLFRQLDKKTDALFYDITSTYFEGESCILCARGYSRDHRKDKKQIVIALVINETGYPLYWKVLAGNTQDVTTMVDLAKTLKQNLKLSKCTLIFDRGMVSDDNLDFLRDEKMHFITALDRDQIKPLGLFDLSLFRKFDADKDIAEQLPGFQKYDNGLYYQEKEKDNTRYILGFNLNMRQDQIETFQKNLKHIIEYIEAKNQDLSQAKRSRNLEKLKNQLDKKLKSQGMHKVIDYQIIEHDIPATRKNGTMRTVHSFQIQYEVRDNEIRKATTLFGLTCFITELDKEELKTDKVIAAYRSKYLIEQSFKVIKNMVKLRPVYLTLSERVQAHVTVCVLSYLLLMTLDIMLKNKTVDLSVPEALDELSNCKVNTIEIKNQDKLTRNITRPTNIQKKLVENLGCKKLLRKSYYKKLLNKMGKKSM